MKKDKSQRAWVHNAISLIESESNRSADTHLFTVPLPKDWGIQFYLKDESTHRTGSLKHRLARSLFLYALVNGYIGPETTIVEASSGSTAVSEAYFAHMLGLPFIAVMAESTSDHKIELIKRYGGACELVKHPEEVYERAEEMTRGCHGHFMDQFTFAERAVDWRGNNNIADSIFAQMSQEQHPVPSWIVVGAGTGGTSATIGRYLRYHRHSTQLAVVDPENSAFYPHFLGQSAHASKPSRIEGIGRDRMVASFIPSLVDTMIQVPDSASIAAMRQLKDLTGISAGPSTGTNVWGAFSLISQMLSNGESGSIVALLCDAGDRYAHSYYDPQWLKDHDLHPGDYTAVIDHFLASGEFKP